MFFKMKTIGFIGLGLIGGSIAKAIRKYHPDYHILAFDQNRDTLAAAVSGNIIDGVCEEKDTRFGSCDYVFLCAPVEYNLQYLEFLKEIRQPSCIITDVGSVKGIIHEKVEALGMTDCFVGGHPMAGSERSGFEHSSDRLVENDVARASHIGLKFLCFQRTVGIESAAAREVDFLEARCHHLNDKLRGFQVRVVVFLQSSQKQIVVFHLDVKVFQKVFV